MRKPGNAETGATADTQGSGQILYRRVTPQDFNFAEATRYRRTGSVAKSDVEWSTTRQEVSTHIGGIKETSNIAEPGDAIITGEQGERYVQKPAKFWKLYEHDPDDSSRYRSKNVIRAVELSEPVEMMAPWGELQRALPGGWVAQTEIDENDVYLIEKRAFGLTYQPNPLGNDSAG